MAEGLAAVDGRIHRELSTHTARLQSKQFRLQAAR